MDPNACLAKLRELSKAQVKDDEDSEGYLVRSGMRSEEMADLLEALDQWLSKGGFLPEDWQR
jgi:hypothetical protein